jgi:hypothetical protein
MKTVLMSVLLLVAAAEKKPDFTGTWEFDAKQSTNVAMMSTMQLTETIEQSATTFVEHGRTVFNGQEQKRDVTYDLGAKPTPNQSPMGDPSTTVTTWDGSSLVTTWTSSGAVAGTTVTRVETRTLSADGKIMTVESRRGSNPPVTMVFARK